MFGEKTPNFCADHVFGWNVPGDCGENPNHSIWHQGEVELIDSCMRIPLLCTLAFTPAGIYGCDPHMGVVLNIPSMIWVGWWVINMWIRPVWSPEIGACGWRPLPATCTENCGSELQMDHLLISQVVTGLAGHGDLWMASWADGGSFQNFSFRKADRAFEDQSL
jgi:hypothetical protein